MLLPCRAGRPPEDGEESFYNEDTGGWLHLDQTARRRGLHAYQGAVYLETADHDDWTFEVSLRCCLCRVSSSPVSTRVNADSSVPASPSSERH